MFEGLSFYSRVHYPVIDNNNEEFVGNHKVILTLDQACRNRHWNLLSSLSGGRIDLLLQPGSEAGARTYVLCLLGPRSGGQKTLAFLSSGGACDVSIDYFTSASPVANCLA